LRTNKFELIQKLKQLEGLSQAERSDLIDLVNTKKKYGLVWEDKPEDAEDLLKSKLPVFHEVVERRILSEPGFAELPIAQDKITASKAATLFQELEDHEDQSDRLNPANHSTANDTPNHILIEGDNLHALIALTFTHEGSIDAMYFDPQYNTGAKDWRYNNDFVVKEDSFRHSKWYKKCRFREQ
jgi:adenine-specific DNA-methyltransferase